MILLTSSDSVHRIQPKPYPCWWRAASATLTYTVSFTGQRSGLTGSAVADVTDTDAAVHDRSSASRHISSVRVAGGGQRHQELLRER